MHESLANGLGALPRGLLLDTPARLLLLLLAPPPLFRNAPRGRVVVAPLAGQLLQLRGG